MSNNKPIIESPFWDLLTKNQQDDLVSKFIEQLSERLTPYGYEISKVEKRKTETTKTESSIPKKRTPIHEIPRPEKTKISNPGNSRKLVYKGVEYPSIRNACQSLGLNYGTVMQRKKDDIDIKTLFDIFLEDVNKKPKPFESKVLVRKNGETN
ncbi:MAG: hypothetical protein HRU19_00800 [Pseudobacteriovorax sp.]|nr:hypothetical protein [Pseudobacteriovorax sp.]